MFVLFIGNGMQKNVVDIMINIYQHEFYTNKLKKVCLFYLILLKNPVIVIDGN